jgi:DNA mismatch repair protein PMS2
MAKASQRSEGSELLDSLRKHRSPSVTPFRFDPQAALRACAAKAAASTTPTPTPEPSSSLSAALSAECSTDPERGKDCEAAARVFSRVLNKGHFQQMVVLGQFNLGFIIVRVGSDIFILDQVRCFKSVDKTKTCRYFHVLLIRPSDSLLTYAHFSPSLCPPSRVQHACDEKYNFETLQSSTTIHEQRLILPLPFEASAMEEVVILDNLEVFRQNGFRFLVDEEAPPMKRLQVSGHFSHGGERAFSHGGAEVPAWLQTITMIVFGPH